MHLTSDWRLKNMHKPFVSATLVLLSFSGFALAQAPAQAPAQPAPLASQLTPQMLGEMLRSATTFHELVRNLNLSKSLGPDQDVPGPDGQLHHPIARTAATIGAGAGAGAAIGEMTHNPNGVLIGALIGGAGGLIVDQILKHQEELRQRAVANPPPGPGWHGFKDRDPVTN
jgi:hypothetical protein